MPMASWFDWEWRRSCLKPMGLSSAGRCPISILPYTISLRVECCSRDSTDLSRTTREYGLLPQEQRSRGFVIQTAISSASPSTLHPKPVPTPIQVKISVLTLLLGNLSRVLSKANVSVLG